MLEEAIIAIVETEKLFLLHELKNDTSLSLAEGRADYHFLVLTRDQTRSCHHQLQQTIENACAHIGIISVTVFDAHLFCFFFRAQSYFFPELNSARLLYDYGHVPLPRRPSLHSYFIQQQLRQAFSYYLSTADQLYRVAHASWMEGIRNIDVISTCVRYIYTAIEVVFTGYNSESHNLYWLRRSTARFSNEIAILFPYHSQKERHLLYVLNKASLNKSVREKRSIGALEYDAMLHRVQDMLMITLIVCPDHINKMHTSSIE